MAKPVVVSYRGAESSFDHIKLEREKLYGRRVRVPLDREGQRCERAYVTEDGALLLRPGMIGQGYFDVEGRWVPTGELMSLDPKTGEPMPFVPSTLGTPQPLEEVAPETVLGLQVNAVHRLLPRALDPALSAALEGGAVFRFPFNYGSDYHAETALLVANPTGTYCLVGVPLEPTWSELDHLPLPAIEEPAGELDFEMF